MIHSMNTQDIKNKIHTRYPRVQVEFNDDKNILIMKNIVHSKRFDMGYAWDLYAYIKNKKIINKIYKCRTYDNVSVHYEKQLEPTEEVKNIAKEILHLLNVKEDLL